MGAAAWQQSPNLKFYPSTNNHSSIYTTGHQRQQLSLDTHYPISSSTPLASPGAPHAGLQPLSRPRLTTVPEGCSTAAEQVAPAQATPPSPEMLSNNHSSSTSPSPCSKGSYLSRSAPEPTRPHNTGIISSSNGNSFRSRNLPGIYSHMQLDLRDPQQQQEKATADAVMDFSWVSAFPQHAQHQQCCELPAPARKQHAVAAACLKDQCLHGAASATLPASAAAPQGFISGAAAGKGEQWGSQAAATMGTAAVTAASPLGGAHAATTAGTAAAAAAAAAFPSSQQPVLDGYSHQDAAIEDVPTIQGVEQAKSSRGLLSPSGLGLVCNESSLQSTPGVSPLDGTAWQQQGKGNGQLPAPMFRSGFALGGATGSAAAVDATGGGGGTATQVAMAGFGPFTATQVRTRNAQDTPQEMLTVVLGHMLCLHAGVL